MRTSIFDRQLTRGEAPAAGSAAHRRTARRARRRSASTPSASPRAECAARPARRSCGTRCRTAGTATWTGWPRRQARRGRADGALARGAARSIMLGMNYGPDRKPAGSCSTSASVGNISVYARNRDYHDLIKGKLKDLAGLLSPAHRRRGQGLRRHRAADGKAAGRGGRPRLAGQAHRAGLAASSAPGCSSAPSSPRAELPADAPHPESCGTCRRCLDICPTNAFPAPFQLDARRCLAYLNIEHKTRSRANSASPMGNRIFGCDDCLAVCPWNKFASATREAKLAGPRRS